jgi:hypothetical protein
MINVKDKPYFIPMLRIIEMIPYSMWEDNKRVDYYVKRLIECLTDEGYIVDAKLVDEKLRYYQGENVAMAVMDENNE